MKQQASSRSCFVCGVENAFGLKMRFYETETDPVETVAEYTVPRNYQGYPGVVHGGILAAMMDEVTSRVVMRGNPPRIVVTAKLSMRYRKPVPVETPLKLRGWVVEDKGKVVTVAGSLHGPDGTLLTQAEAVVVEVDPTYNECFMEEDSLGWRVYPIENSITGGSNQESAEGGKE